MPFEDSRRLTGCNLFFASTGAVLEVAGVTPDDALLSGWRERVDRARSRLGWASSVSLADSSRIRPAAQETVARLHATGASLALAAPCDQLYTATEVNEWALCAALHARDPMHWASLQDSLVAAAESAEANPFAALPPVLDEDAAMARFEQLADLEARPDLRALIDAADARGLQYLLDESVLTLGAGHGSHGYELSGLPFAADVPWDRLHGVPTALVTGSNGKTTTVRLIAACTRAAGWRTAYSCTDGVFVDGESLVAGDYSGPVGARMVMREPRCAAAVIETARGGILRRGIAVNRADVAIVTNVSSDHFGEYGIHDLGGLADAKLTVAGVVRPGGLLVLNADDAELRCRVADLAQRFGRAPPVGWFALDDDALLLKSNRERGGSTCGVRNGRLLLARGRDAHDLGVVASMPLTVDGSATYNIANLAAAALAAAALGVPPSTIASVFAGFGTRLEDNAGRMMRFEVRGVTVLLDYAHNPEGVRGLMKVARHLRSGGGRVGILLGHAGNRQDSDMEAVARVAAEFRPDFVVIKETEAYLRGRQPGEVPRIFRQALLRAGFPESALAVSMSEMDAVRRALDWARPGDVLALPVHSVAARMSTVALLRQQAQAS
ncbi:MAG: Mur ligase [Gammaproteobacteria bacterium]|nr:Mur ligase [Gammaproteobacteria bacterium]